MPKQPSNSPPSSEPPLRYYGVDIPSSSVLLLEIYFFDKWRASVRNTSVVYDRTSSYFVILQAKEYDWSQILTDTSFFCMITAVSLKKCQAVLEACQYCSKHNIQVVSDFNYHGKIGSPKEAQATMAKLMPYVDIFLAHDEDFEAVLEIKAFDNDMTRGIEQTNEFIKGIKEILAKYPKCQTVASILRNFHSVEDSE